MDGICRPATSINTMALLKPSETDRNLVLNIVLCGGGESSTGGLQSDVPTNQGDGDEQHPPQDGAANHQPVVVLLLAAKE